SAQSVGVHGGDESTGTPVPSRAGSGPVSPAGLGPQLGLALAHGLPALGHGRPEVAPEGSEGVGQVGADALGGVASGGLPHEAHEPERDAEPEAGAHHEPEEAPEHQRWARARRSRDAARPVPEAKAIVLMTGFEKA